MSNTVIATQDRIESVIQISMMWTSIEILSGIKITSPCNINDYKGLKSGRPDLNRRPSAPHADTLAKLRYAPLFLSENKSDNKAYRFHEDLSSTGG